MVDPANCMFASSYTSGTASFAVNTCFVFAKNIPDYLGKYWITIAVARYERGHTFLLYSSHMYQRYYGGKLFGCGPFCLLEHGHQVMRKVEGGFMHVLHDNDEGQHQ